MYFLSTVAVITTKSLSDHVITPTSSQETASILIGGRTETGNSEITFDRSKRDAAAIDLRNASSKTATMSSEVMEDAYLDFVSTISFSLFLQNFNRFLCRKQICICRFGSNKKV